MGTWPEGADGLDHGEQVDYDWAKVSRRTGARERGEQADWDKGSNRTEPRKAG